MAQLKTFLLLLSQENRAKMKESTQQTNIHAK
jgi:hypothetical protein